MTQQTAPQTSTDQQIKAQALREFAARHQDQNQVLYLDLDRNRVVRVSTLAIDDARALEAGELQ